MVVFVAAVVALALLVLELMLVVVFRCFCWRWCYCPVVVSIRFERCPRAASVLEAPQTLWRALLVRSPARGIPSNTLSHGGEDNTPPPGKTWKLIFSLDTGNGANAERCVHFGKTGRGIF